MKIVIIGGHPAPALAVLDQLAKDTQVLFIGRKYVFEGDPAFSFEYRTVTARGIPWKTIVTGRLQRRFSWYTIPSLIKIIFGFYQAIFILKSEKPGVVLSFGGYLSVPISFAAFLLRIPVVIHEQTMQAGLANKITAKIARKICLSWESSARFFPSGKTVLTGNPIQKEILALSLSRHTRENNIPILSIFGGSSGSRAINKLIENCLTSLLKKFVVYHQTGEANGQNDFKRLSAFRLNLPVEIRERYNLAVSFPPVQYAKALQAADLVIARSGINTVTELLYLNKPALLIPLPSGQRNEQLVNAQFLKKCGLAEIAVEKNLTAEALSKRVMEMFAKINEYKNDLYLEGNIRNEQAAQKIIEVVKNVTSKKQSQSEPAAS